MIEFDGMITGEAEKFLWNKAKKFGVTVMGISFGIFIVGALALAFITEYWMIFFALLACAVIVLSAMLFLPQSKKQKEEGTPKKIYIEDEFIIAIVNDHEEYRYISEAKELVDYGEFYDVVYTPADKFVCQKSLLSKGTLKEFEALFEGKLRRVTEEDSK